MVKTEVKNVTVTGNELTTKRQLWLQLVIKQSREASMPLEPKRRICEWPMWTFSS